MGINTGWGGGSGTVADGSITTAKIDDGAVTVSKIGATGTPGSANFLRGDGAWAAASSDSVLGENTLTVDGNTINITLSEPIGDDEYIVLAYNFVTTAVTQFVKLQYNGETSEIGYTVNAVPDTAKIYTGLNNSVRSGTLTIAPISFGGNLIVEAAGVIWDTGATLHLRTLTGLTGITSIQLIASINFKAGSNARVIRLSGAGATGPQGPAGPAGGLPETNQLAAAAQSVSVTGLTADSVFVTYWGETNAASGRIGLTINGETSQTGYNQQFTIGSGATTSSNTASNDWNILSGGVNSGVSFSGEATINRYYDGTNTIFNIHSRSRDSSGAHSFVTLTRSLAGDVDITAVSLINTQATGLKARSGLTVEVLR